jgi:glycosyltransferase involved in cell wall biosynthesis
MKRTILPLSVLVLTYNEEANVAACLQSVVDWASEIFVVDSGSSDGTLDIVEGYNCHVVNHPFVSWGIQINWALGTLPIQTPWVLRLDADEYVLPKLRDELIAELDGYSQDVSALYVKRRAVFMGRWIRYGGYYPVWLLRFFRPGKVKFEQHYGESEHAIILEGKAAYLRNDIVDHNRKGLAAWTMKHEGYAQREVISFKRKQENEAGYLKAEGSLGGSPEMRRRWLKGNIYERSPLFLRAFMYFIYRYFLRLGFLDGVEGLIFHFLQAGWYRFYVDAKIWEASNFTHEQGDSS